MRTVLGTGYITWQPHERRTDRYGSVMLKGDNGFILFDPDLDRLEGRKGKLVAEVLVPVKSEHVGDLARDMRPSTPDKGEVVLLGEGELFIEHRGRQPHEQDETERLDDRMAEAVIKELAAMGIKVVMNRPFSKAVSTVYDIVGLHPLDDRKHDWLNPRSLYRVHASKVNLFFDTEE